MASENEASCESDPNFAVICGFLEKFGITCGLANIDFVDLQEMLENTQEVSHELIELHVKLMRRARRSVSSNDRWERALIKTCHTFSSQDAWEIERFGYKKARISSKLRVLKELLEMQFDYNQKFKNEINKMSATELRTQPLGRDRMGRAYWFQCDESCQIRVYKDDPDDETWSLVARDRDGLVSLITQLGNGDTTKSSSEPVSNEDSNSVEVEKPTLDTGQTKPTSPKPKIDSDNAVDEKMEIDTECTAAVTTISESSKDVAENKLQDANLPNGKVQDKDKEKVLETVQDKDKEKVPEKVQDKDKEKVPEKVPEAEKLETKPLESKDDGNDEDSKKEEIKNNLSDNHDKAEDTKVEEVKTKSPEESCENALNLCSKDISNNKDDIRDEKACLDLSVKATPCLRIKPITELMPQPHVEMQKKEFMGIKGKYIRNDSMEKGLLYPNPTHLGKAVQSASYDAICYKRAMEDDIYSIPSNLKQPRFDRPTLLGKKKYMPYINEEDDDEELEDEELDDEIEEPLMLVQGEGSGLPNESVIGNEEDSPIVGEVVEDPVLYVSGEGNGVDCETGNKSLDELKEKESKEKSDDSETSETRSLPPEKPPPEEISLKSSEQTSESSSEDKNNTSETILDNTNNGDSDSTNKEVDSPDASSPENVSSPLRQTFFFGNSFSPNTSPMKTASLSFGASTVVESQNARSRSISPASIPPDEPRDIEASKRCFEKTDQNLVGNNPSHSKVPENVDIENVIDNNKKISERLLVIESEDKIPKESELGQRCDKTLTNTSDFDAGEVCEDKPDCGDVSLVTPETGNPTEPSPSSQNGLTPSETFKGKTRDNNVGVLLIPESTATFQNPESSNSECPEEATTSDCAISNLPNDLRDNYSGHEVTTRIEEKVSSTVIEEEPTTSDESNTIASINTREKVDNTIKSVLPDSCLEDREVTGAPELECIESSGDEMDADGVTSGDDVPTSTTDIKHVSKQNIAECASKDINISVSISDKVNEGSEAEDTDTINHNKNSKELSSMDTKCEAESTKNIFNDVSSREDVNEPAIEISDNVIDSNQMEENNDLLSKENEVDVGDNTKDIENNISTDLVFNKNDKHKQVITDTTNVQIDSKTSNAIKESTHITNEKNASYSSTSQQLHTKEKDNENKANITEVVGSDVDTDKLEEEESLHSLHATKVVGELSTANRLKVKNVKSEKRAGVEDKKSRSDEENIDHDHNTVKGNIGNENVQVETAEEEIKNVDGDTKDSKSKNKADQSNIIKKSESAHGNVEKELSNKEPHFDGTEDTQAELENKDSPVVIIETDEDTSDTRSGIDAIKAIKITNVQAKCEILEKVEDTTTSKYNTEQEKSENVENKHSNPKEKALNPQPLRFLRGRRPNQMLSVKSYATRNKNLVLRKEIKPQPLINDKNDRKSEKNIVNNTDPLLNVVKIEDHVENNVVRRSTRRKPGDHPQVHPIDVTSVETNKKPKGRPRKNVQNTQEPKQIEEVDVRHSKRLRLSNNQIPSGTDVETIDLTAESDGRRISARNCNENIPLRGGMTIKPIYKEGGKPSKSNGPFLTCVNIQKLKENPLEPVESPLSVESSGGGDNSDVVIIEDDPLAVPDPYDTAHVKGMTLNSFQLDVEPSYPQSTIMTRSLRKRGITEPEISVPTGGKRRKTKGKRQVDLELRRSIEEQKKKEISSSDEEKTKEQSPKRKPQPYKKKQEVEIDSDIPAVKPVKKPRAARKKTLLGLDVPAAIEELNNATVGHVRQSRRIAQLKIKEEAERRKLEDITMTDPKESKKKSKKNIDKDYKAEKRKRPKPPTEEEVTIDVPEVEEKKKKRKRKRKHKDPRKIFDESNPWRSSSGSSSSNDEVEEEEEDIAEYSEAESPLFKSDHEFSPESDIEDTGEPQPLKRARTARKEDDIEDDIDDHACQKCGKSDHPEWILLCDGCDNGWHCSCLRPALFIIPEGDWFCPPCQHNTLVKQLEEKLVEFDKKMAKREIEVRRKERLAYVGISLANVLPVKDTEEKRKKREKSEEEQEDEESESEQSSSSESSSSSDSDEPIYQLRQRRQAHSYRFNDYDELINSAIQDEMEAVKGAGNQGRGKDISTIVNAEKEQAESGQPELEPPPPVVPVETKELPPAVVPPEHHDSDEDKVKPVKKFLGRKKQRKLNSLDVSSGDDPYSDEDFKESSSDEEDDDDFEEDLGSDSSEAYGSRRRKGPVRRSTRARTSRYDKDFINDDTEEDEEIPRKKKSRSVWNESDTEESDISWKWSSRRKSSRNTTSKKKRSKKSKKHFDDSDEDRSKKKKRRIKYGGLNDDEEEEETAGRRTRGKKINYADVLASDSDDEIRTRKAPPRIESDDDYVANEDEEDQDNDEEYEKEECVEKEGEAVVKEKPLKNKENEIQVSPPATDNAEPVSTEVEPTPETEPTNVLPPEKPAIAPINPDPTPEENFDLDNLNSSIDDLPDDIVDDNDVDDELNPIDEINKNLEEMDEEEMEKLMEEEEYANKQLQLVAMQLEKEKKRKEREAKKKETAAAVDTKAPKKRGKKKSSNVVQIATLQVGPDMQSNPELSEPPGVTIPIFSEIPPSTPIEGSPKKRRGRGKGKKTLEKEAAAAAAAAAAVTTSVTPTSAPTSVTSDVLDDQSNIPTTVDTVASVNSDDVALANAAAMHGAELAIAAPPQPFSQTQPTPSVITRMLQTQPGAGNYSPIGMGHNYYADQPPPHVENSPTPPVSNSQMATCVPVSNSMAGNQSTGQLPSMSQAQQPYMHGAPSPRGMPPSVYRQPPPNVNPYQRTSPAPSIPPMRVRTPAPSIPPVYHSHHPLDPSPSGGGPINVPTSSMNTPDRSSPVSIPPSSDSPLSNKSDPTPPPPPYSRPQIRFSNVNTSPMTGSPIRQNQPQQQPPTNLIPPQHMQQQPSPLRNNMPPYHPAGVPPNYYGSYMQGSMGPDDALPPSGYNYSDQFSETNSPQDIGKSYDEENSGEFGGLVSYFSSQREDDLDT